MFSKFRLALVDDWRECWKWASVQLLGVSLAINLVAQAMPVLDPHLAALLPERLRDPATGLYAFVLLVARIMQLKKANG